MDSGNDPPIDIPFSRGSRERLEEREKNKKQETFMFLYKQNVLSSRIARRVEHVPWEKDRKR